MELGLSSWDEFKTTCIDTKSLSCQYSDMGSVYRVIGPDSNDILWLTDIQKGTTAASDFEDNYKDSFNGKIELRTTPDNNYMMQRNGTMGGFTGGTASNLDFKIENYDGETYDVKYIWGADFLVQGATFGDWAQFQIVDVDDVLGMGAGTVIKEYIRKKYIYPGTPMECSAFAPGAVPVGLYLRCVYHSTDANTSPVMCITYHLEVK